MADNDEYRVPEETEGEFKRVPPELIKPPSKLPPDLIKRIVIIIGVIFLGVILLKIVGYIFWHKPTSNQMTTLPSLALTPQSNGAVKTMAPTLDNRVGALEATSAENKNRLEKLEANVSDLQNSMGVMTSQLTAINNALQDISHQVADQADQLKMLTAPKITKVVPAVIVPRVNYFVQALIPGRAWLRTSNGGILTVRIGDSIPGYGMVESIDPSQGVITTSSGETIQFKSDDS